MESARPRRDGGRASLLRAGRQPSAARDHGRRPALPPPHARAVRPDRRRRVPAALRALLPRDPGVLPARAFPPGSRRSDRAQRRRDSRGRPARRGGLRDPGNGVPARRHLAGAPVQPVRDRPRPGRAEGSPPSSGGSRAARLSFGPLSHLLARDLKIARASADPWTDDRAPVEWITDRMILEFAARGGSFEEYPLPTAP